MNFQIIAAVALLWVTVPAQDYFQVENVVRVYDGDTFFANLRCIHPFFGDTIGIRINNVDTPEIRGSSECVKKMAYAARDFVENILLKANQVELRNCERGKYFRVVADVYADGQNIAELLIKTGYAKPYDGGEKSEWTCQN